METTSPVGPSLVPPVVAPTLGRTVIVKGARAVSNGADEQAAVVTRAWSANYVNLMVLPDNGAPFSATSVHFEQTREAAHEYLRRNPGNLVAYWPPRV